CGDIASGTTAAVFACHRYRRYGRSPRGEGRRDCGKAGVMTRVFVPRLPPGVTKGALRLLMGKLARDRRRRFRRNLRAWQASAGAAMPSWLVRRFGHAVHHLDLWLIDYGIIREAYANLHQVR